MTTSSRQFIGGRSRAGRRTSRAALLTASVVTAVGGPLQASALSGPGVCAGVRGCQVRARADVNGDGTRDAIGVARRGANGVPHGAVLVRVKTGPQRITSFRARTEYWYGPPWQGVAHLDPRRGKEIVVGFTTGAHAQFYRALTWRHGDLVTLDAPGPDRFWYIDGAVWVSAGWQRRTGDPVGTIRQRVATRIGNATTSPFKGTVKKYRWTSGGWTRVATRTIQRLPDETAYRWGGFHVPGLARW